MGVYRVQYSAEHLDSLIPAVSNMSLPARDRLGLQNDIFALVNTHLLSYVYTYYILYSVVLCVSMLLYNLLIYCILCQVMPLYDLLIYCILCQVMLLYDLLIYCILCQVMLLYDLLIYCILCRGYATV